MKKYIILLIALISSVSCKKINVSQEQEQTSTEATTAALQAGAQIPSSFYIPEDEGGWETWYPAGRVGLFNAYKQVSTTTVNSYLYNAYGGKIALNSRVKIVNYDCLIANGIPGESWDTTVNNPITRSGVNDFIVNSDGSQSLPLQITTYANGEVYLAKKKDEFDYTPTDKRIGEVQGTIYSGKDFIWWGWGDNYYNSAIIPDADGLYVIAVSLDYANPNPTTSLLPIKVTGTVVTTDTTAIVANAAKPATNYKAVIQRGKVKGVNISWEGSGYAYCIVRDGVMIARWQDIRSYFDPAGNKFSVYSIITRAQGRIPDAETPTFKVSVK
jgi:hypothetical protein